MIKNKDLCHAPVFDTTLLISDQHKLDSVSLKKTKRHEAEEGSGDRGGVGAEYDQNTRIHV